MSASAPPSGAMDVDKGTGSAAQPEEASEPFTLIRNIPEAPTECQICVVGAGPSGLMLATNLTRFGVKIQIVDDRSDQTSVGRADGLQPKTIETFRQMRLSDPLLRRGARVYDISFWRSTADEPLHRLGREVHYPPIIDVLDRFLLLVHQGMVESIFIDDMRKRGVEVRRNTAFESYGENEAADSQYPVQVNCRTNVTRDKRTIFTKYLVGCDGANSKVRKIISDAKPVGISQPSIWGVLDGELQTNFPDIWEKTVVFSEEHGSVLIVPRERNMTRLYIELKSGSKGNWRELGEDFVMERAKQIMAPFDISWKYVEWFGRYQIGQRVANRFCDPNLRAFIAGDASHTHSPKSAQGMNTSIHDAWNLAWKLNFAVRGFARQTLLESYEDERRKVALDLVNFDYEHANRIAEGDAEALAENFKKNFRIISGIGAEYGGNAINMIESGPWPNGDARPGSLLPPAKVTRFLDSNPVDLQLDIPMLGQFRIFLITWNAHQTRLFLETFCKAVTAPTSLVNKLTVAARESYEAQPRLTSSEDLYTRPERYTSLSNIFTFSLITTMSKAEIELSDLPPLLQESRWTFYLDDIPEQDTRGLLCIEKWLGTLGPGEVAIVNVRPDGYVGSIGRWKWNVDGAGEHAAEWLNQYYDRFLQLPGSA